MEASGQHHATAALSGKITSVSTDQKGAWLDLSILPELLDLYDKYESIINPTNEQELTGSKSNMLPVLLVLKGHVTNSDITTKREPNASAVTVSMMADTESALGWPHQTLEENWASVIVRRF
jgi:hypothetical protein